ncbi:COG1399 protein, clustered with ribosomal protein L32p [Polaromonas sp. CG9_12]|nr:COG1399 protein, clustered with ribosomal protein L32p [Polaromonas sp. CG9_12]
MSKFHHATRLNMHAFAQEGVALIETIPLQNMERLAQEANALAPDLMLNWEARAELRPGSGPEEDIWLHLVASASVPLTCQRCMGTVATPLAVNQWYRFVATEAIAMAEDDESEEDLLVMEPHFDLLALLEDELLMALPLVPMHGECPVAPVMQVGEDALAGEKNEIGEEIPSGEKPNPFAVLAQLKKKSQ